MFQLLQPLLASGVTVGRRRLQEVNLLPAPAVTIQKQHGCKGFHPHGHVIHSQLPVNE